MAHALALARRGLGMVAPNPAVGCVLVRDGRVVGRGSTGAGGRPHAETRALAAAGAAARGATAYVTLEPCSHHGKTPPCADALVKAGIARVVAAMPDPDPRVDGAGFARLKEAGVVVDVGLMAEAAMRLNLGFVLNRTLSRPLVTLKFATTLDGRIATRSGESQWITGPDARRYGHLLRATHDAILIGSGTATMDDPLLTCRLEGLEARSPIRIVLDRRIRLSLTGQLVRSAGSVPLWVFVDDAAEPDRVRALRAAGVRVFGVEADPAGLPDIAEVLGTLAGEGITRLLVEGGATVAASFLRAGVVDEIACFRSGAVIGGDGVPALTGFGLDRLDEAPRFERMDVIPVGDDLLETFRARA